MMRPCPATALPALPGRVPRRGAGFSLLEVLVALTILTAGLIAVAAIFPTTLQASRKAELLTHAAALAQQKAEEIRRDNDRGGRLLTEIRARTTPTAPVGFQTDPRLAYSFSGTSLLYTNPADVRATPGVARVIVRHAASYDPNQEVIYELRFN